MALNINTNIGALGAAAAASSVNKSMETSMTRLSTGLRINTAADDAAGVAIASRLTSEIRGTNQAIRNAMDGQAMIDTAEGAHNEVVNILQRMRELSVQAANDTNGTDDRANLQAELTQLKTEIDRIAEVSTWAGKKLLYGNADSGSGTKTFTLQVGNGTALADQIDVKIDAMTSAALKLVDANATVDITNLTEAGAALDPIVENLKNTTDSTGTSVTLADTTAGDGKSTITIGNYTTAEKLSVDIEGQTVTFTTGNAAFADDAKGAGAGLAAAINAKGIIGITAADDGNGVVTVTKTASVSVTDSANKLTINSYDQDETISIDLDGTTISFKNDASAGYTLDKAGAAAHLADTINSANIPGISASASGAVVTLTKGNFDITTAAGARAAVSAIDTAIGTVNTQRANLGAISNRLDNTVSNLTNISTNLEAGRSRIQDADFAAESTQLAKSQILQQASTAMLAQANASKQTVLSLLQG